MEFNSLPDLCFDKIVQKLSCQDLMVLSLCSQEMSHLCKEEKDIKSTSWRLALKTHEVKHIMSWYRRRAAFCKLVENFIKNDSIVIPFNNRFASFYKVMIERVESINDKYPKYRRGNALMRKLRSVVP